MYLGAMNAKRPELPNLALVNFSALQEAKPDAVWFIFNLTTTIKIFNLSKYSH